MADQGLASDAPTVQGGLSPDSSTEQERSMMEDEKQHQARRFLSLLGNPNEDLLRSVAVEDVTSTFPGTSPISSGAHGIAYVMKRASTIAAHGVRVEIAGAIHGLSGVAIVLHSTASRDDQVLVEQVATVFSFRGDKVSRLDTFSSDMATAEAFFA
jgi:ketosteroid isomerase-like protein